MSHQFISCLNVSKSELDLRLKERFPDVVISQANSMHDVMEMACKSGGQSVIVCTAACGHAERQTPAAPAAVPVPAGFNDRFTQRQRQLIDLLMSGNSNKAIADRMNLSYGTVKNYVFDIMRIMSVGSRLELVARMRTEASQTQQHPARPGAGQVEECGNGNNPAALDQPVTGAIR